MARNKTGTPSSETKAKGKPRPPLKGKSAEDIIAECHRVCAMCYCLENDGTHKYGQLAHLDQNRANNNPANLTEPLRCARTMASHLGYIHQMQSGTYKSGLSAPSAREINAVLRDYLASKDAGSATMSDVLVNVFLEKLGVTPVRVHRAWEALLAAGLLGGIEPRQGGSRNSRLEVKAVELLPEGWKLVSYPLDEVQGCRDLKLEGSLEQA